MRLTRPNRIIKSLVLAAAALAVVPVSAQEAAGRILMAIGEVAIKRGASLTLAKKGAEVLAGDAIVTGGTSNAQVKFSDGAVVALRPNTEFKVNEYKFSGKADGSEAASLSLVKGGVRAVTGAIGRGNRDNLKVDAVVATVGIRGTGFNIVFCDAACLAASPTAKEGLYAGVFEGKIAVSNRGGSSADLGVNRFTYVQDENSRPQPLIAPPSFLKDSLEGQVRIRPKEIGLNSASVNNAASTEKSVAAVKAPTTSSDATRVSADVVGRTVVAAALPDVQRVLPGQYFDNEVGSGNIPPGVGAAVLRSSRYDPSNGTVLLNTNQAFTTYTAGTNQGSVQNDFKIRAFGSAPQPYSIQDVYVDGALKFWKEGGRASSDSGQPVIAWGRWAGTSDTNATAVLGTLGVNVSIEQYQGFHYIYGVSPDNTVALPTTGSRTMTLIGGTIPTEARANALEGWRLTGGKVTLNYSSLNLTGNLDLFYGRSDGYGNFSMTWDTSASNLRTQPGALVAGSGSGFDTSVKRTSGNVDICATAACAGRATFGLYGPTATSQPTHSGMSYSFNTGTYNVQGVAVFK